MDAQESQVQGSVPWLDRLIEIIDVGEHYPRGSSYGFKIRAGVRSAVNQHNIAGEISRDFIDVEPR